MSLSVVSSPESLKPVWYEETAYRSIGGKQTVLRDELTRASLRLSPEGLARFEGDDDFHSAVGSWAVHCSTPIPFNIHQATKETFDTATVVHKAGADYRGPGFSNSSVVVVDKPELVVKTFEYGFKGNADAQFDTMQYLGRKLRAKNQKTEPPTLDAPLQFALMSLKKGPKRTIFMEKIDGPHIGQINHRAWVDSGFDRTAPKPFDRDYLKKLRTQLYNSIPLFGCLLIDDLKTGWTGDNWFVTGQGTTDERFYLTDQPKGGSSILAKLAVKAGNLVAHINPMR